MYKSFSMELAGRTLTVDVNRVAKQANGAAFMHYGDTSGTIVKNKTSAKDGNDWYFYVEKSAIKMYTNNNTLSVDSKKAELKDTAGNALKDWKTKSIQAEDNVSGTPADELIDDGI